MIRLLMVGLCGWAFSARAGVASEVEAWNLVFEQAVQTDNPPPALAARNLAILHVAMHDAYFLAGEQGDGVAPLLAEKEQGEGTAMASPSLSASVAGAKICAVFFPSRSELIDARLAELLAQELSADKRLASLRLGTVLAQQCLAAREKDGSSTTVHYVPREGPGQWRRTTSNRPPELPHWPNVKPFVLQRADQFRPPPPPPVEGEAFARSLAEVQRLGGATSTARTPEQTLVARFWSDFSYTSTPPGHWNHIARNVVEQQHCTVAQRVRLFAVLNLALADAGLAAFDAKYHYHFWRPVTALGADQWTSLLPSPSHPEYVSAHSTFSAAAAGVLEAAFPNGVGSFEVQSDTVKGAVRRFDTFLGCEEEVGVSRIYGGIHYSFSNIAGRQLGRKIAAQVVEEFPLKQREEGGKKLVDPQGLAPLTKEL